MSPANGRKIAASKKKKQTRLAFEPVDLCSSPAPSGKPPAKIRYTKPTTALSKRQIPSSSAQNEDGSDSDDIIFSNKTPIAKSKFVGISKKKNDDLEEESEDEITATTFTLLPTRTSAPKPTSSRKSSAVKLIPQAKRGHSDSSDLGEEYTPLKGKNNKGETVVTIVSSEDDGSQIPKPKITKSTKRFATTSTILVRTSKVRADSASPSDFDSEGLELPRRRKPNQTKKPLFSTVPKGKSSSPRQPNRYSDSDSDSDEIVMSTQAPRRKRQAIVVPKDDHEESEDPITSPLKRPITTIESDDSDIVSSPLKRRRKNEVFSEDETSEDELQSIHNEPRSTARAPTPSRTTRQSRIRRHRTEKEKKLELLKRRRAGENIEALTESEESESQDDSISDFQELSEFEDDEEEVVVEQPRKIAKKKSTSDGAGKDPDAYDSDFIEDDDEGTLGVPAHHSLLEIPLEFTNAAHKPMKEHFKDAVEWMVHNKINPAFSRDDPIYEQAFKKLDDEYGGYAKSKFVSTQWTAEFTRALYARPEFLVRDLAPGEEIAIAGEVICQVCNHRRYVPKYQIQFGGKAYYKHSLEEVEQDDSCDDSDEAGSRGNQNRSVNVDGQVIPSEERTWLSGQYCKANAEQAHSLIHWKYALNQWVIGNLEHEGYLTPQKLAEREKMKAKQKRKYANDIVDDWEAHNQIKDLYRDFKINLEAARNATSTNFKNGRFRGR